MVNLKKYCTRRLLYFLNKARACGGAYDISDNHCPYNVVTINELKAELATREHIPNKREARIIRQNKAKRENPLHSVKTANFFEWYRQKYHEEYRGEAR